MGGELLGRDLMGRGPMGREPLGKAQLRSGRPRPRSDDAAGQPRRQPVTAELDASDGVSAVCLMGDGILGCQGRQDAHQGCGASAPR
eukprot:2719412-Pyramimonas_sp.AAC.1